MPITAGHAMTGWQHWLAALCLVCSAAQAKVQCPPLFNQEGSSNTYYARVFLDQTSEQDRDHLKSVVDPLLHDIVRDLNKDSTDKKLDLKLIACAYHVGSSDFSVDEMKDYLGYKVVAVFWKSQEDNRPGLVQLAVPVYLRSDGASRRDVEVVTLYAGKAVDPIESWIEVFVNETALYKPFVTMGLATVYQQAGKDYKPAYRAAWRALCDSRIGLAALAPSTLRPKPEVLAKEIAAQLLDLMVELEQGAKKAGISLPSSCTVPAPAPVPPP